MGGMAFSAGPNTVNRRIESLLGAIAPFIVISHPDIYKDLLGPAPQAAPEQLKIGDRVWCYPGESDGYEGYVTRFLHGDPVVRDVDDGLEGLPTPGAVVLFDENHNQKRAFKRGRKIEYRFKEDDAAGEWYGIAKPSWDRECEYRVAPEAAPVVKRVDVNAVAKAAYARGERIECRTKANAFYGVAAGRWHYVEGPAWHSDYEYRVQPRPIAAVDEYADLRAAIAAGKTVQIGSGDYWIDQKYRAECPDGGIFGSPRSQYRIKPETDPYADLKAAQAAGKQIQTRWKPGCATPGCPNEWQDTHCLFDALSQKSLEYRIKPTSGFVQRLQMFNGVSVVVEGDYDKNGNACDVRVTSFEERT